mgnify:FL=1|tara:strand:- start:110 stop:316 length:207 start_codon:yes stop_codon:yes gene_type:complete
MPRASRKSTNTSDAQLNEGDVPRSEQPTIIERGKKFAAYDKFGKLIILGYDQRIVQEYADAQSKVRSE